MFYLHPPPGGAVPPAPEAPAAPAAPAGPAHQDRAYEFVGCPMKAAASGGQNDIDPTNMVLSSDAWEGNDTRDVLFLRDRGSDIQIMFQLISLSWILTLLGCTLKFKFKIQYWQFVVQ